jgi:hypothetical protein
MAKQKGVIPLSGTLDGINFYIRKGTAVARKAGGGFNGKAIKNSTKMVRVRENNSEFGHCSRVKKVFKDSLANFFLNYKDAELHGRMMQLFIAIKDCDLVSERGKRRIDIGLSTQKGKELLKAFLFTSMPFTFKTTYDAATHSLTVINPNPTLVFPKGATHLELYFGVLVFDFDLLKATLFKSNLVLVSKNDTIANMHFDLATTPTGNGKQFPILFCNYVQEVNGVSYYLREGSCFGLWVLDVV